MEAEPPTWFQYYLCSIPTAEPIHPTNMKRAAHGPATRPAVRAAFLSLVFYFASCTALWAHDFPLDAAQLHEAYVLGQRNDQATSAFLTAYSKPASDATHGGPHVAEIEVLTPFAQVVDRSRERASGGYSEQQAATEYRQRGDTVLVRVRLMLPSAYPKQDSGPASAPAPTQEQKKAIRPENFWQNFRIAMKQGDRTLTPGSVQNKPIYSAASKDAPSVLDGATVWLEYDAKSVASEPATVEIVTPDSKTISATFDLQKLR
jgi:hypothetical protein